MEEFVSRAQPSFCGNPKDLERFLQYASSPIRSAQRDEAKTAWEAYKLPRQFASLDLKRPMVKGEHMSALIAPAIDLRGANLDGITLGYADLRGIRFDGCSLRGAWLKGAVLRRASFAGADLSDAGDGRGPARLLECDLQGADFTGANLSGVDCSHADMGAAILERTDLTGASIEGASLVGSAIQGAILKGTKVYGVSAWDLRGEPAVEQDLLITPFGKETVTVDQLRVAQFIYLLLDNPKIRGVIDTVTAKAVLLLGRFTDERKAVLEELRKALRLSGLVPILFDFDQPGHRDLTETIQVLAGMARFVIADLTDAKSVPQELSQIVPSLPSVPVQPIILAGGAEYSMFEHWTRYPWVLPGVIYTTPMELVRDQLPHIVERVESFERGRFPTGFGARPDSGT
jgi:hypothetical protein